MRKKTVMWLTIAMVSALAMPVYAQQTSVTYQTQGIARFSGSYTYPDNSVVQTTDTHNPFYGDANEKHGQPVLPNTGAQSFAEQFGLGLLSLSITLVLALYEVMHKRSND